MYPIAIGDSVMEESLNQETTTKTESNRGYLDTIIEKVTSRKLLAWITATALLYKELIGASDWAMITLLWIGVQGAIDWYKIHRGASPENGRGF